MEIFYLVLGFVLLFFSGNYIVKGSVSLARHLNVSTLVVGVIFVSFGTSAPELVVSLKAALESHPDISTGNIIGSNISNIALVLAVSAIVLPISVKPTTIKFDWPIMMIASLLFYFFSLNYVLETWEGIIFILMLIGFIWYSISKSRRDNATLKEEILSPEYSLFVSILIIMLSCAGLVGGANFMINGATKIARELGVSERIISISIVALGTSIPELATSVAAAFKKEMDISIGNIIGSNIFNILAILGITSIVKNITINPMIVCFDIFIMLGISLLLFIFILPLRGGTLSRLKGILLFCVYIVYIWLIFNIRA
jgi:cation:H+ antiporter